MCDAFWPEHAEVNEPMYFCFGPPKAEVILAVVGAWRKIRLPPSTEGLVLTLTHHTTTINSSHILIGTLHSFEPSIRPIRPEVQIETKNLRAWIFASCFWPALHSNFLLIKSRAHRASSLNESTYQVKIFLSRTDQPVI